MEFLFGVAAIIFAAKIGEAIALFAKARSNMGATLDIRALHNEVHALREEIAAMRSANATAHPLATSTRLNAPFMAAPTVADRVSSPVSTRPDELAARLERLQNEMAALRDTTTQFDMSFDAAVDRLERRLDTINTNNQQPEKAMQGVGRAG